MSDSVCPRCGAAFHCGADDSHACWCTQVRLDADQRGELAERYVGCLCPACLAPKEKTGQVLRPAGSG